MDLVSRPKTMSENTEQKSPLNTPEERKISRRGLLRGVLAAVGLGAAGLGAAGALMNKLDPMSQYNPQKPDTPEPLDLGPYKKPLSPLIEEPGFIHIISIPDFSSALQEINIPQNQLPELNTILAKTPSNEPQAERSKLEQNLVEKIAKIYDKNPDKLNQIDIGLMVVANLNERNRLVNLRYHLRQETGHPKLRKLTQQEIDWCKNNLIYQPEVLGIALDIYPKALRITQEYLKKLGLKIKAEDILLNPGGLAKLITLETTNLSHIGNSTLSQALNREKINFSVTVNDLEKLFQMLKKTGLSYLVNTTPVSERGDKTRNLSGGAIGAPQFMPSTALRLAIKLEQYGITFNPFHPNLAALGALLYPIITNEGKGNIAANLRTYNQDSSEVNAISNAHKSWQISFKN